MAGCRLNRLGRGRITLPPKNFAAFRVDGHGDLVVPLARKFEDPALCVERRCVALSNGDFPFSGQLLRPSPRLTKMRHAVPVGTSPLRPILSPETAARHDTSNIDQNARILPHSPPPASTTEVYITN